MEQKTEIAKLKQKPFPRKRWEKAFRQMHLNKHDNLLIDDVLTDQTLEEWIVLDQVIMETYVD